ncbi:MAG: UDP-N-acetylglucosamine--N-acetylmuramyl-(pentapeptide) pyrophosphoryl-undecaprenol N-acetylglucosamine transferase [Holosporales bacterium]|jgi:UDP-N-acetylglucosamine--N-acetylmuramyl-(pentapeptide) pyrophosphoryl-undecaprenol N-acetylglucosamine transferase|nr:UDP-N-acetylglucosamine--N-acetylmuramyl-(pentapeptide) pyrophosphoryl-undecaprenol N-acetylglucosamine transferase [Holosporales bacterium]
MKNLYVLAAGGTGGHLFPAESLAQELKARGYTVVLFTDERVDKWVRKECFDRVVVSTFREKAKMKQHPSIWSLFKYVGVDCTKDIKKVTFVTRLVACGIKSLLMFLWQRPRAVVGFGGYPSAPTVLAAQLLGIRSVLHECNAIIGRANKVLARNASAITTGFRQVVNLNDKIKHKQIFIGNPVRGAIADLANVPPISLEDELCILVVGGSQGARLFANVVPDAVLQLPKDIRMRVTMQVGEDDIQRIDRLFKQHGVDAELAPFFYDMSDKLAHSHVVISRGGATSLAEFAASGIPSILVPLESSRDGDQLYNAMRFEANGAAVLMRESTFSASSLCGVLSEMYANRNVLREMSNAAREMYAPDAGKRLADAVTQRPRNA